MFSHSLTVFRSIFLNMKKLISKMTIDYVVVVNGLKLNRMLRFFSVNKHISFRMTMMMMTIIEISTLLAAFSMLSIIFCIRDFIFFVRFGHRPPINFTFSFHTLVHDILLTPYDAILSLVE